MSLKKIIKYLYFEVKELFLFIHHRIFHKAFISSESERMIIDQFHNLYYHAHIFGKTWGNTYWLGTPTLTCPLDLWIYQEIMVELKPDIIIECGTYSGGGALFLATLCDMINHGKVITIDIEEKKGRPQHRRINYLCGSSVEEQTVDRVKQFIRENDTVMVILDSDHHAEHVLSELRIYSTLVTRGSYIIVEDTNLNGNPIEPGFGPGPMEAVVTFLKENSNFVVDKTREKLFLTFNPNGYLKRIH